MAAGSRRAFPTVGEGLSLLRRQRSDGTTLTATLLPRHRRGVRLVHTRAAVTLATIDILASELPDLLRAIAEGNLLAHEQRDRRDDEEYPG